MKHERTFRIDRLYHKFLKPETIPLAALMPCVHMLEARGFIKTSLGGDRYSETDKLSGSAHKKELFTLIAHIKTEFSP